MKLLKPNFKKAKKKVERIMGDFKKYAKPLDIKYIFKNTNGKIFNYIKEIKETDEFVIVRLKGAIDAYTIPKIKTEHDSEVEESLDKHILLNFREVNHIDSATLASLLLLLNDLKKHNRSLCIIDTTFLLKDYLNIYKLELGVQVYKDEKAALRELRKREVKNKK